MAAKPNSFVQEGQTSDDIPLTSLEESLLSLEKLDRASPELWPEQMPGVSEFAPVPNGSQSPPSWNNGFTKDDYSYMQQLNSLSTTGLIMEVKRLHDVAYQLGLEEAKEMTRGKYLNIFTSKRQRFEHYVGEGKATSITMELDDIMRNVWIQSLKSSQYLRCFLKNNRETPLCDFVELGDVTTWNE